MSDVFNFLFNTIPGVGVLFLIGIVVFGILAAVLERRTHQIYVDRGPKKEGEDDGFWG